VRLLRGLDLDPIGFVPPAWLARDDTHRAAGDLGLRVTEDERAVRLHPGDVRLPSPVVRWSGRTAARARASALVAGLRGRVQRRAPVPRLALHPADLDHPVTRRSLERALARWVALRGAGSYRALVDRHGARAARGATSAA
jgi:predicted deacetylase